MQIAANHAFYERTRHVEVDHLFIREIKYVTDFLPILGILQTSLLGLCPLSNLLINNQTGNDWFAFSV